MSNSVAISTLMDESGVKFGTSGARGLVTDMTDKVCYAYTLGFLRYLESVGELPREDKSVAIAGDNRSSTDRIMTAVAKAVADGGYEPVNCGKVPSPAVGLLGLKRSIPAVMVTGSHIPDDRNGIKYNKASGEILKNDETGIKKQVVTIPDLFDGGGMFKDEPSLPALDREAADIYVKRWLDAFGRGCLEGKRIGLYEHSAVGRDLLFEIFTGLGAAVTRLARSEAFIPVDTEAIRPEDVRLAEGWAKEYGFDTIVSTDGDSDRPLMSDENGQWLRGDVAGIVTARFLEADVVVTPVSCNTAVEKSGYFDRVHRTRIGSPFVIEQMHAAVEEGGRCVVGYEANGGFLTASPVSLDAGVLGPLPTRDPVIVHLGILMQSIRENVSVSELFKSLPQRFTASGRLKDFPVEKSRTRIAELTAAGAVGIGEMFPAFGPVKNTDTTDGLRITFENDEILHLRPSGNAPELRCYTEASTEKRAWGINEVGVEVLRTW